MHLTVNNLQKRIYHIAAASQSNRGERMDITKQTFTPSLFKKTPKKPIAAQSVQIPEQFRQILHTLEDSTYNPFEIFNLKVGNEMAYLLIHIVFEQSQIGNSLGIKKQILFDFASRIQSGYLNNLYHNQIHGFDVTATVNVFLRKGGFAEHFSLKDLEFFSVLIASAGHDVGHPGLSNQFLVTTGSLLAMQFNDQSPLENYHASLTFQTMQHLGCNVAEGFTKEQFTQFRKWIIGIILATDNAFHNEHLAKLKEKVEKNTIDKEKDKLSVIQSIVHAADVSTPIKPFDIDRIWAERVLEEFFVQGDKERQLGLPVSYLCDRFNTNLSKSQIGFANFLVLPLYRELANIEPRFAVFVDRIVANNEKWNALIDESEKALQEVVKHKEEILKKVSQQINR